MMQLLVLIEQSVEMITKKRLVDAQTKSEFKLN